MQYPSSLFRLRFRVDAIEFVAGAFAPALALLIRDPDFFGRLEGEAVQAVIVYIVVAAVATVLAGGYFRIGQIVPRFLGRKDVRRILKASAAASILTAAIAFSLTRLDVIPRSIPILHFIVLSATLTGWRLLFGAIDRKRTRENAGRTREGGETMIVAGANDVAHLFLRMMGSFHRGRARVVAILDDNPKLNGRSIAGVPVLGTLSQADAIIHEFRTHGVFVDRIVVAFPDEERRGRAIRLLDVACERHNVVIDDLSERLGFVGQQDEAQADGGATESAEAPPRFVYLRIRNILEKALAAAALIVLAPIFFITGMLVWIDVGRPLVFWQERVGLRGRTILLHKFRTLKAPVDANGVIVDDNDRLSVIGSFLRRTRLDELPQLFDILRGQMSFIGPRPLLPADMPEGASLRHLVAPGLTGWAQVHGGNLVTNEEKNALDEWYIHHASFGVDLAILLRTLRIVILGEVRENDAIAEAIRFRNQMLAANADGFAPKSPALTAATFSNVAFLPPRNGRTSDRSPKGMRREGGLES